MALDFNTEPYFDDYDQAKDYYRILFRPSYAVQARELTQIQTILQNQVSRFGDHVFKNGSQVIPGSVNVDNQFHFIKLEPFTGTIDINTYIESFRDKIITGEQSGVKLRVVDTSQCDCVVDQLGIATLYCKIEGTAANGETKRLQAGENIIAYEDDNLKVNNFKLTEDQVGDITAKIRSTADDGSVGTSYTGDPTHDVLGLAYGVDVKEGIYYIDGIFVRNPELHLYVGRFDNKPTARVGFQVVEETVAPEDDVSLLDNATGSYNYAAPGAHRYKISLKLVKLPLLSTDNIKFVELLRVVDGRVQQKIEKATYAEIAKTLARRTFDESGNYEVNKFMLSIRDHLDDGTNYGLYPAQPASPIAGMTYGIADKAVVAVDPGKAYIDGYEVEAVATQYTVFDKARGDDHVESITLDPVGVPIGNYALVSNVYAQPNISSFEKVYLVKKLVVSNGALPTSTDVVGTARVKAFQLHSGDYTAGTSTQYKLALLDIQMYSGYSFERDVKSVSGIKTSGTNFTCDIVPTLINLTGGATIANASPNLVGSNALFASEMKANDIVYIDGVKIGTISTTPTGNNAATLVANYGGTSITTAGKLQVFRATLNEQDRNTLLYSVGYEMVKTLRGKNSSGLYDLDTSSIVSRVSFSQQQSSTADGYIKVTFNISGGEFLDKSDLSNFTLFDTTTSRPVAVGVANIEFNSDSNRTSVTFKELASGATLLVDSRNYTLIASVTRTSAYGGAKAKNLEVNYADYIYDKRVCTASTIELAMADVYRLIKVEVDPTSYVAFNPSNAVDITDYYTLDNGQRPTHYTNGKLNLKAGMPVPSGCLKVTYDYFTVAGPTGQYFTVDSYTADLELYQIPTYYYSSADGKKIEVSLGDVIDFRPVIAGNNTWYPEIPKIGTSVTTPIAYYMGRQDKIVLDSIGRFNIIKGVPSLYPKEPEDPKEGMVLATMYIPPYTKDIKQIKVTQRDNRRYTMKDIGKLEKRISNLEYYVALSTLEKDAATMSIKDDDGFDKFKNGFIVDTFTGHGIGDVKNEDYRIAVDAQNKHLRPMTYTTALQIVEDLVSDTQRTSLAYQKTNDLITLPYTESEFIFNSNATRSIDVNPYKIGAFKGEVILTPEGDNWMDTDRRPDKQVTDNNNYDAIKYMADKLGVTGTVFNYHEANWSGQLTATDPAYSQTGNPAQRRQIVTGYQTDMYIETGVIPVDKIVTSVQSTENQTDYGDRVVDMSFAPYMRARPVSIVAKNLKGNTRFWAFFDNINVNAHIKPSDIFTVERNGTTKMSFDLNDLQNQTVGDNPDRAYNGKIEPAFAVGDLVKNEPHTATKITGITHLTSAAATFTLTVQAATGIKPGHHVRFENMALFGGMGARNLYQLYSNQGVGASQGIASNTQSSRELNMRVFKVTAVNGSTITLANPEGGNIAPFSAYNVATYTGGYFGKLQRLQASAVVSYDGFVSESDIYGIKTQQIHLVNIRNGFAVNDVLAGSSVIAGTSNLRNSCTVKYINGSNSTTIAPTMKVKGDSLRADVDGTVVGVFDIPNSDSLAFRTGERTFKLIDNESNSDANFDSKGSTVYYSQGVTLSKEKTIVNSRTASFVQDRFYEEIPTRRVVPGATRQIYSYYTGHDPVAQTFIVSSTGGVFVTSVDIFFREAGVRPVTIELRSTNNSIPGTKVIPFSQVTKTAQQLNLSDDGSAATTFTFSAPIYLQDGETYALIVKTDEPGCQLFISELGKNDLITDNVITSQPLTGSLYLSQNSKEFEINPLLDMKFILRKAVFDTSNAVTIDFRANPPAPYTLQANPFEITPNTNKVRVYAQDHGFKAGEKAVISGVVDGYYGTASAATGIPASALNTEHIVQAYGIEKDSFIIEIPLTVTVDGVSADILSGTTADFIKGNYGGNAVVCTRSLNLDILYLKTSDLNFQDTNISYQMDVENMDGTSTEGIALPANANYTFPNRKHIRSYENQSFQGSSEYKVPSLKIRATLSSSNKNVSPVIDTQKLSAYTIANLIDNLTQSDVNVVDIDSRTLLADENISIGDIKIAGSGTISSSTANAAVTGSGGFTSGSMKVVAGNKLWKTDGTLIGTVLTVNSDTSITLTGNAAVTTNAVSWSYSSTPSLVFSNTTVGGVTYGLIATNIDTADNLLANATIGKYITISGTSAANPKLDGTYVVKDVYVQADSTTYAGNADLDKINVLVYPAFTGSGLPYSFDMEADLDFDIKQLDKYVEDFAPVGCHNAANYITRSLNLAQEASDLKIIFDACIVNNTDVKIFYRTWNGTTDLSRLPYKEATFNKASYDADGVFKERTLDIKGITPGFTAATIKIVMKSSSPAKVPILKNFRVIATS